MTKYLLTLSLSKARDNAEVILKTYEVFIKETYITLPIRFVKIC